MTFYQLLFSKNINGVNRNLTWYWNLFVRYLSNNVWKLLAKILKIKGNTIVWNQLNKDNFTDATKWAVTESVTSISVSGNVLTITSASGLTNNVRLRQNPAITLTVGHTYLYMIDIYPSKAVSVRWLYNGSMPTATSYQKKLTANAWNSYYSMGAISSDFGDSLYFNVNSALTNGDTVQFKNYRLIDLTVLNDSRVTDRDSYEEYYPLGFYATDSGSLLSFDGTGIKTVGKNLFNGDTSNIQIQDVTIANGNINQRYGFKILLPAGEYVMRATAKETPYQEYIYGMVNDFDGNYVSGPFYLVANGSVAVSATFTLSQSAYLYIYTALGGLTEAQASAQFNKFDIQLEFGSSPSTYVPYSTNTLSLPISIYFPTGMKDIDGDTYGKVYDELTPNKAITRIGSVDLGSLVWVYDSTYQRFNSTITVNAKLVFQPRVASIKCAKFECITDNRNVAQVPDKSIYRGSNYDLSVHDSAYNNATAFKTAMNGVMLQYELATPTEVSIDPALALNYEIEWGGTEQLLPENTSTPTTSPILADIQYPDGERDDQYFTYREITQTNVLLGKSLNTIMGREVEFNREALDILMKGE